MPKETSHVYWESRHANILNIMLLQLLTRFIANMTELQNKDNISSVCSDRRRLQRNAEVLPGLE